VNNEDDFEETGSFAAGSVRFLTPEIELPSAFSAESESAIEPEPEPESAVEPEDSSGTFDSFEPGASFEPEAEPSEPEAESSEPEAPAEPDVYAEREESPATESTAEPEDSFGTSDSFEPDVPAEPEVSAEPESRARPEFSDVFTKSAFFSRPTLSPEPESPAERDDFPEQENSAAAESGASAASSDLFTRPEYTARSDYSNFFTRPSFFPSSEGDGEQAKPAEEPHYSALGQSRHSGAQESVYSAPEESRYPMPGEPPRSFSGGSRYSGPKETPYSAPEEPRHPTPGEPRRSFSEGSRYSGPQGTTYTALDDLRFQTPGETRRSFGAESRYPSVTETPYSAPEEPRFTPFEESRYSGPAERRVSRPEETAIPAAPSQNGTGTAAEPAAAETPEPAVAVEPAEPVGAEAVPAEAAAGADAAGEAPAAAEGEAAEPAVTVEVPGRPAAQHPVRSTGELSVLTTPELPATTGTSLPDALWAYDAYPVLDSGPTPDDQGGLVSVGYLGAAIGRKKKVWILTTVLGVLAAAGLYHTYHATYTDTSTLLLALDPNLDTATAIQTDAVLAVDSTMAQQAMRKLGVQETVPSFLKTYAVSISTTSNNLLTFTATAGTSTAAYNEANALATTFLQYRAQVELEKESANTAAQEQQVTQTQQAISSIVEQIHTVKAEAFSTAQQSQLTRLESERTNAQTFLTQMEQTVASAEATSRSQTAGLIAGSRVLDAGIPTAKSTVKKFALTYGGGAIFGGFALGLLIVVIGAIISDRLRRRDDVAAALGAPVRVSVASGGKRSGKGGKQQREADLKRIVAHLRDCVPRDSAGAGSLVVVAVDETRFVSEAIKRLATSGAREGKRMVVADLSGGALGDLFGTKEPGIHGVDAGDARVVLVTPEPGDLAPIGPLPAPMLGTPMHGIANVHAAADQFITLVTVNPATGGAHLKSWADEGVAVVTVGESSVTKVQAAGEMVRFAGVRLTSAILLGADAKDDSLGYGTAY
jgi:hypothetical protein